MVFKVGFLGGRQSQNKTSTVRNVIAYVAGLCFGDATNKTKHKCKHYDTCVSSVFFVNRGSPNVIASFLLSVVAKH